MLPGYGDTGAAIVNHPDIDKIAFTGTGHLGSYSGKGELDNCVFTVDDRKTQRKISLIGLDHHHRLLPCQATLLLAMS